MRPPFAGFETRIGHLGKATVSAYPSLDFQLHRALYAFLERDEGLGPLDALNVLDLVMQDVTQVFGIPADDLGKDRVDACSVVDRNDLRNPDQLIGYFVILRALFEVDTQKGNNIISQLAVVYFERGTSNDAKLLHLLHPDMDGATRYIHSLCDFGVWHVSIFHQQGQNFEVHIVNV